MTLDEAIRHLQDILGDPEHQWSCDACRQEHEELLEFLQELKTARFRLSYIENENPELAARSKVFADFIQSSLWKDLAEALIEAVNKTADRIAEAVRTIATAWEDVNHGND